MMYNYLPIAKRKLDVLRQMDSYIEVEISRDYVLYSLDNLKTIWKINRFGKCVLVEEKE